MRASLIFLVVTCIGTCYAESRLFKATKTPCCVDTLLPGVCKALYNRNYKKFVHHCRRNPDFSFIQCCHSCHFNDSLFTGKGRPVETDLYQRDVEQLLLKNELSACSDRHGTAFCCAFASMRSGWARGGLNCGHGALAFRLCRKTCGYCSGSGNATVFYDSDIARNPRECQRLI